MASKVCAKCKKEKDILEFYNNPKATDKKGSYCDICTNKLSKRWKLNNKAKIKIANKKCWNQHKNDPIYRFKQKVKMIKWRNDNKQHIRDYKKEYQKKNRLNPRVKLMRNIRSRIQMAIKNKSSSTMFLIGCSIDYLMYHIQEQFKKGMTWDNHGRGDKGKGMKEWHIDHIKPCSSFDLSKIEEQHRCFHYSNLQPLWAEDNLIKGKNYD